MDQIRPYATFLLHSQLDELTKKNIELAKQLQVPLLKLLAHLDDEQLHAYVRKGVELFLVHLSQGTALEYSREMIHKWNANEIPAIKRDKVGMEDLTLSYSIRKQILITFLPSFSLDVAVHNAIVLELEGLFQTLQWDALQVYFQIENEKLLEQNGQLQAQLTQLNETQLALKESQSMAHLGNWVMNIGETTQIFWSEELYHIYGLEPGQPVSLALVQPRIHPDDYDLLQVKIQQAMVNGLPYENEYRIVRKDGQVRTLFSQAKPVRDANGKVIRLTGVAQDVTERKAIENTLRLRKEDLKKLNTELLSSQEALQALNEELQESHEELQTMNEELREQIELRMFIEAALRENEKRFRVLANNSSDMISTHTPDGYFTYVSPACKTLLGYTESELLGRLMYDLFHPADIHLIQDTHTETLSKDDTQVVTYRMRTKAGEYVWFESTGRSIRDPKTDEVIELHMASRNITLRKLAEDELDRERGFLKAILDHIADGIVACDEQGRLAFFNQATRKFHGIPEQAIAADQWAEYYSLYYPDGQTLMQKADIPLFKAFRGEEVLNVEMVIAPRDGLKRTLLATGNQITSKDGRLLGAVVVMHDVTHQQEAQRELIELNHQLRESNEELVRTEELLTELNSELEQRVTIRTAELAESNERFQFLADSVPLIIWTSNAKGTVEYFNQSWYKYTGLNKADSLQWGWQMVLHPDDLDFCTRRWLHSLQTGELYQIEYRLKSGQDSIYRWHLGRGIAMKDENGTITKWFGSCTDIHDQKIIEGELREKSRTFELMNQVNTSLSAELELEKIVQTVTDVTTELTGAEFGAFFYNVINDRNETLTLYTLSGAPVEAFSSFPMPRNTAVFGPTFHGEGIIRSDDITQDPRYGKNPPYSGMPAGHLPVRSYLAVPVISRSGEVIGGLFFGHSNPGIFKKEAEELVKGIASQAAIAMDNSRLFDKLKDKNSELIRSNTELDSFMYTASHDLKAPIVNIEALFSLLIRKIDHQIAEPDKKLFDMINISIAKFNRTIRDLTEITAIQKNMEGKSEVSFPVLYEDVKEDVQQMIVDASATLHTDFQVELLMIEKKHLRSVFYNLLTNAIKYRSSDRPLVVTISTFLRDKRTVLQVSDNGLGIKISQQPNLFKIFKRLHTHVEGSGVGLYMIKRIIENNGGSIEVDSEEGRGTTFTIIF